MTGVANFNLNSTSIAISFPSAYHNA